MTVKTPYELQDDQKLPQKGSKSGQVTLSQQTLKKSEDSPEKQSKS